MFGYRPPSSGPSTTQGSNVPETTNPNIFQQSQAHQSPATFSTSTAPFGLFQPTTFQQGIGTGSNVSAAPQAPLFAFNPTGKTLLPTPSQAEIQAKTKTSLFKSPQFGSFFEKSGPSQETANKNLFTVPNVSTGISHPNISTQAMPTFSFTNPTSVPTLFRNPTAAKSSSAKQVTFNFGNSEEQANRPSILEPSAQSFNIKASNDGGTVFGAEMGLHSAEGGSKPAFSFVKAKDISEKTKSNTRAEESTGTKSWLKMDEETDVNPKKKLGIKSRISLPLKPPTLKIATDKPTKSKSLRSPTAEEISKITSIICKDIPDEYNNKQFIAHHFSKFGTVKSTRWNNKKKHVTVTFLDHASARAAKTEGCSLGDDEPKMAIFWATLSPRRKSERDSRSELDKELQSMGEGGFFEPKLLSRPETSGKEVVKKSFVKKKEDGPQSEVFKNILQGTSTTDESLHSLLERTATNIGDRFEILDARDKLMRMKMQKQSDIYKAIAVVGTCPDMCPEKERYSRAEKNGLSLFELHHSDTASMTSCNMNPKAVVKEYSRSSADQEEPLSHELCPPHVLNLTMDYLLCNLMDVSSNAGEWFDFIWNRTRAIRKDITQQHLCDCLCASLVEKCARFHIHCAAAFSHEDISVFDPKINNENLTKCLQTLKHFYHDLSEKGVFCPNEAEFMAYDILLNLNEGDTIRQAQQLRQEVRESDSVRFATEVFFAQNSNNYVRFFRLVRKASYLNACILQRYFPQVRRRAFSAICKAYRNVKFPILDLIDLLAFEDVDEVEQYCEWLQLHTEAGTGVLLRKFVRPSTSAPSVIRSSSLINSKRVSSIGAVVNGGPLPDNPYLMYEPHDSFGSNGRLKKDAYDAQDQSKRMNAVPQKNLESSMFPVMETPDTSHVGLEQKPVIPLPVPLPLPLPVPVPVPVQVSAGRKTPLLGFLAKPDRVIFEKAANDIVTEIYTEAVQPLLFQIAQESFVEVREQFLVSLTNQTAATITADVVNLMSREISESVFYEEFTRKQKQEEQEFKMKAYTEMVNLLFEDVLVKDLHSLAQSAIQELKQERLDRVSSDIQGSFLKEFLREECATLAKQVFQQEKEWAKKVQDFILRKRNDRARKLFIRWHCICVNRRTFENAKKSFPSGPLMGFETVKRIKLDGLSFLPVHSHATLLKEDSQLLLADLYYNYLNGELSGLPINVLSLVKDVFLEKKSLSTMDGYILWKLLVFTPSSEKFNTWINLFRYKFSCSSDESYSDVQDNLWASKPNVHYGECPKFKLGVSTLHLSGQPADPVKNEVLKGMSALLLPIICPSSSADFSLHLQIVKQGLHNLLHSKAAIPSVPVVILLFTDGPNILSPEQEEQLFSPIRLDIDRLVSSGVISRAKIFHIFKEYSSVEIDAKISEAVQWLAENTSELPNLTSSYLDSYLEDGLKTLVLDHVFQDLAYKSKCFNSSLQSPDAILSLYNAAIQFLGEVACDSHLQSISWPAPEFEELNPNLLSVNWNQPYYLKKVMNMIINLKIGASLCRTKQPYTAEEAYSWIERIKRELRPNIQSVFISIFQKELSQFEANEIPAIPWASILFSLFSLVLSDLAANISGEHIIVRYKVTDLQNFRSPRAWIESTRDSFTDLLNEQSMAHKQENVPNNFKEEIPEEIKTDIAPHSSLELGPEYYQTSEDCKSLHTSRELNQSLQLEKVKSQSYTQWLKSLSEGDHHSSGEEQKSLSPSTLFDPLLFDLPSLNERRIKRTEKRKSLSDNLDDSFYVVQQTLRNENESSKAFQAKLKLLHL